MADDKGTLKWVSYTSMVRETERFIGITPLLRSTHLQHLERRYGGMICQLTDVLWPMNQAEYFCYQLVFFVRKFAQVDEMENPDDLPVFYLVDLSDHCNGLPACEQVIRVLSNVYHNATSYDKKIAAAECVGRLRRGIDPAIPLFLPLLASDSEDIRNKTVRALSRTIRVQTSLAAEFAAWGGALANLGRAIELDIERLRSKLCFMGQEPRLSHLLAESGCLSHLELLAHEQAKDGLFFETQKDWLLAKHMGKYIAIRNGAILAIAETPKGLEEAISKRVGTEARVLVSEISVRAFMRPPNVEVFLS